MRPEPQTSPIRNACSSLSQTRATSALGLCGRPWCIIVQPTSVEDNSKGLSRAYSRLGEGGAGCPCDSRHSARATARPQDINASSRLFPLDAIAGDCMFECATRYLRRHFVLHLGRISTPRVVAPLIVCASNRPQGRRASASRPPAGRSVRRAVVGSRHFCRMVGQEASQASGDANVAARVAIQCGVRQGP